MEQSNYIIGLDLGINNVGWAILDLDNHTIEKSGVRLFNPSDDASGRRQARSVRRRLKRQKNRINDSLKLLKRIGIMEEPSIDSKLLEKRVKGLNEKITKQDIVNIVKYFMSHRGYIPFDDEEVNFVELNGQYPCEYYLNLLNEKGKIRALNETVKTYEIEKEFNDIIEKQINYYSKLSSIKSELVNIFKRKREFWQGPGSEKSFTKFGRFKNEDDVKEYYEKKKMNPSYEKYLFEDLIGKCNVIYLNEKCAPVANFYAQEFNLINDFTNLTFSSIENASNLEFFREIDNGYKLSTLGIQTIIDYCINFDATLKLDKMFKEIFNLSEKDASGYRLNKDKKNEMSTFDAYRKILRIIKNEDRDKFNWISNIELYNKVMYYINVVSSSIIFIEVLTKDNELKEYVTDESIEILKEIYKSIKKDYIGYHSLSEKALKHAINDMLATELNYQQVSKKFKYDAAYKKECAKSYISENGKIMMSNKYIEDLVASPQVKKTLRQSIKIINAIINEKGSLPYCISIESEKEVNGKERRLEIEKEQKNNEKLRKIAKNTIEQYGYDVTEALITKVMLYEEINGRCPYCNEQTINLVDVLNNRIEVEHILPLSKTGNDSFNNKTLACRNCNSEKSNNTPYEWKKNSDYEDFKQRIKNNSLISEEKKLNFLFEEDLDKYSIRFINRNLRDTAYATKELVNQVNLFNCYLDDNFNKSIKTLSTPGQITHKIREHYN